MKNIDLRTLNKEARKELRRAAIIMFKARSKQIDISKTLGIRNSTITSWIMSYKKLGKISDENKRGRPIGDGRRLCPDQEDIIQKMIIDKTPDQYKLSFALWTNAAIQQLIDRELDIKIPQRTLCDYLHRWKFTPQRPVKLAYEQQPEAVKQWLDETYPIIEKQCIKEKGEIHWADETGISSIEHYARGYAPVGKTPTITLCHAARERVNMISSITNQGKVQFMIYPKSFNADVFIAFSNN